MKIDDQDATNVAIRIVNHLNREPKAEEGDHPIEIDAYWERLRAYAQTWAESGYRLEVWSMRGVLQRDIEHMTNFLQARPDGQPYLITILGHLTRPEEVRREDYVPPTEEHPTTETNYDHLIHSGQMRASETFLKFLVSQHYARLGRCARCEKWFFNSSGKRTRYCSLKCAKLETSNEAKTAARERDFLAKLHRLENVIREFDRLPKKSKFATSLQPHGWKGWVAKKAGHGITTNFITRVVNAKQLEPPKGFS